MITLLAPAGLAAAAALVVPLLIHWVRRSDRRIISFAAMRYLSEHSHPRERLRLHEPCLLLLRLLMIAVLAVLMALPIVRGKGEAQSPWILLAPDVDVAAARAAVSAPLAEWRWLAPGFPPLDGPAPVAAAPLASLVRQADADLSPGTALTLIVPEELKGLDAERLRLGRAVTWRVVAGTGAVASTPASPSPSPSPWVSSPSAVTLSVRFDAGGAAELPLVRALAAAWQVDGTAIQWDIAAPDAPLPTTPGWLIWLAGPLPPGIDEWVRRGGSVLASRQAAGGGTVVLRDATGTAVLRATELGKGRLLTLEGPLRASESAALTAPDFPQALRELLRGPPTAPDRAPAASVAPLLSGHPADGPAQSLDPYLALLLALSFLAERLIATRSRVTA